ncbi:MAG: IclR family transcriptional regulator [Lachnospiraceae bacterium]|nr:IclR family transcriptional regulator [Lachnospiraceae bacterium]
MAEKKLIQSVMRALEILEFLAENGNNCRLQDISDGLELNKSTVHSLISTLEHKGYVIQDMDSPRYSLGLNCMRLGITYRRDFFARDRMNQILVRLVEAIEETCFFAVRVAEQYFYLDAIASDRSIKADPKIGCFFKLTTPSAISKVFLNEAKVSAQSMKYEVDFEQEEQGMNSMAIPFRKNQSLLGAIAISGPSARFTSRRMAEAYEQYVEILKDFPL